MPSSAIKRFRFTKPRAVETELRSSSSMAVATMHSVLEKPHHASCVYFCEERLRAPFCKIRSSQFFRKLGDLGSMAVATRPSLLGKPVVSLPGRWSLPLAAQSSLTQAENSCQSTYSSDPPLEATLDGELPAEYMWHEADLPRPLDRVLASQLDIRVVDLQGGIESLASVSSMSSVVQSITSACENGGIFYIVNHGVPASLVEKVQERACQLFSLPSAAKMRASRQEGQYVGFGKAIVGKFFRKLLWSEGFTMMGSPNSCIDYLTERLFPEGDDEFRRVFEEYDNALRRLAAKLLEAIFLGINNRTKQVDYRPFNPADCHGFIQLNHYPPCPKPSKTMGLPAHTDSTCLTILCQDNVDGLVTFRNGQWAVVPPLRHSFVVNVGDMLQIISNGRYTSNLHCAIVNESTARHSVAYLCGPPPSTVITPALDVLDSHTQPLYKPLTWTQYLQAKGQYFMGALEHFTCR